MPGTRARAFTALITLSSPRATSTQSKSAPCSTASTAARTQRPKTTAITSSCSSLTRSPRPSPK
eukprot:1871617-Pyramimonas_sp.AAC.1